MTNDDHESTTEVLDLDPEQPVGHAQGATVARRDERGMATAEYAVGTILVVVIVSVIIGIFRGEGMEQPIMEVIKFILKLLMDKGILGL